LTVELIDITVTRTIPAEAGKVFDVWLDPESAGGPWHGAARVILNPVVDGLFYFAVKHAGRTWPHYGRFVLIERPHRIEHTWVSEATKGVETVVTLTFQPRGGQTDVTLRHSGVPDDEMGHQHQEGWTWVLSILEESFVGHPSNPAPA
jgi:uncharacterized protein YndB with AHSA1/START domain